MMKRKSIIFLFVALLLPVVGAYAQRTTSARINEVLVINENNFVDDYGMRHGWIEIYNSSAGTVDLKGCYLTNDPNNPCKYPIPKGDVLTKIKPYQHVLFWADGMASRGTFHVNFEFDPEKENYVALYDSDGRTLIDELTVPSLQQPDVSYGAEEEDSRTMVQLTKVTPSTNNKTLDNNSKIENFKVNDSWGTGMTITAMAVVFLGLFLLYMAFKGVAGMAVKISRRNAAKAMGVDKVEKGGKGEEPGEIFAAIAAAIYAATEEPHDAENTVLTIRRVARTYSPWNSKIYSLRDIPRK